jgi:hypothetical protein
MSQNPYGTSRPVTGTALHFFLPLKELELRCFCEEKIEHDFHIFPTSEAFKMWAAMLARGLTLPH